MPNQPTNRRTELHFPPCKREQNFTHHSAQLLYIMLHEGIQGLPSATNRNHVKHKLLESKFNSHIHSNELSFTHRIGNTLKKCSWTNHSQNKKEMYFISLVIHDVHQNTVNNNINVNMSVESSDSHVNPSPWTRGYGCLHKWKKTPTTPPPPSQLIQQPFSNLNSNI